MVAYNSPDIERFVQLIVAFVNELAHSFLSTIFYAAESEVDGMSPDTDILNAFPKREFESRKVPDIVLQREFTCIALLLRSRFVGIGIFQLVSFDIEEVMDELGNL